MEMQNDLKFLSLILLSPIYQVLSIRFSLLESRASWAIKDAASSLGDRQATNKRSLEGSSGLALVITVLLCKH